MSSKIKKVRVDRWLWAVRIFKSRTKAAKACNGNNVFLKSEKNRPLKPSQKIERGHVIHVKKNGYNMTYKVVDLLKKRVSAKLAAPCYEDLTPEEELNKFKEWYYFNKGVERRNKGDGRPTKKERRQLDEFKDWDDTMELDE